MTIEILKQFDTVLLKDGRAGAITDIFPPDGLFVDVGYSPLSWDNITCTTDDIAKVLTRKEYERIEKRAFEEHPEELEAYQELFK